MFGFSIWKIILTVLTFLFSIASVVGAKLNGYSLPWYGVLAIFVLPWLRQWLVPRVKEVFSAMTNPKRLLTLAAGAIVVFVAGDILIGMVATRFGYFGIPLDDLVSEPIAEALFDFLFVAWYGIAFVPSTLICVNPKLDVPEKLVASLGSHLLCFGVCAAWVIGMTIELWIE